nr:polysaccharide pyruvyl transferase family protein [Rhodococcus sp. MS16]
MRDCSRAILSEEIGSQTVSLLDVPTHKNVGDTMIWQGERTYLAQLGKKVGYETDIARFSAAALEKFAPESPILLHGGGNFGDMWPEFQNFREMIIQSYPGQRIVQLPQTIQFSTLEKAARANEIFGAHKDFVLLLRDQRSVDYARNYLPSVRIRFCPDMALGLDVPVPRYRGTEDQRILALGRTDHERAHNISVLVNDTCDWNISGASNFRWKISRIPGSIARRYKSDRVSIGLYRLISAGNDQMRSTNISSGIHLITRGSILITDRLHAHVLAGLLGIPHIVLDNNYGKISSIYHEYSGKFETAHFAKDIDEAARMLEELSRVGAS